LVSQEVFSRQEPLKPYCPDVFMMAQVIMTKLLSNLHEGLPPNYNSQVMHIVEAYRNLVLEKDSLLAKTASMAEDLGLAKAKLNDTTERMVFADYNHQEEIKRLKLTLASSRQDVADLVEKQADGTKHRVITSFPVASEQPWTPPNGVEISCLSGGNENKTDPSKGTSATDVVRSYANTYLCSSTHIFQQGFSDLHFCPSR